MVDDVDAHEHGQSRLYEVEQPVHKIIRPDRDFVDVLDRDATDDVQAQISYRENQYHAEQLVAECGESPDKVVMECDSHEEDQ